MAARPFRAIDTGALAGARAPARSPAGVIVGRPIARAGDPRAAAARIAEELASAIG